MVQEVSSLKSQWLVSSWQPLHLCQWSELVSLEGLSLLPQENRDENKTSRFLNCHVYGKTIKQYQLNKKTSVSIKYIQHYTITLKLELSETLFRVFLPSLCAFQNRNNWFCRIGQLTNNDNNNKNNNNNNNDDDDLIYLAVHTKSSLS